MTRKKTTLYVDDDLWRMAKAKAVIQDRTLAEYLDELLKKELEGETERLLSETTLSGTRSRKEKRKEGRTT